MEITFSDQDGIELDAEMAEAITIQGVSYSEQIESFATFICNYKDLFQQELQNRGFIQKVWGDFPSFELAAVDGASAIHSYGGGSLIAAAAYKATINAEKQRGVVRTKLLPNKVDIEAFANLLRMHLEFLLLTKDKLDEDKLVILDHSFWGILQAVSRALNVYKVQLRDFSGLPDDINNDININEWLKLFHEVLDNDGSLITMMKNKNVISLSKQGTSQFIVNTLRDTSLITNNSDRTILSGFNDRLLLKYILQPGEYTTPKPIYDVIQESGTVKSWKRSRFVTSFEDGEGTDPFISRELALDEYGIPRDDGLENPQKRLFVTYYRPYSWSRVYRIEFHELLLKNHSSPVFDLSGQGSRFQTVLGSLRKSVGREIPEPITQFLADLRSKAATTCSIKMLPDQAFYALWQKYGTDETMLDIVQSLLTEERS